MKFPKIILLFLSLFLSNLPVYSANFAISNVGDLLTDTLYTYESGTLMNTTDGGVVTIGYFSASITLSDINTIQGLHANLDLFTVMSSAVPGSPMSPLGGLDVDGYADNSDSPISTGGQVTSAPLLNRAIYSIVTNADSIIDASNAPLNSSLQLGLVQIGTIVDESLGENLYTSNPSLGSIILGSTSIYNADIGFGAGNYTKFSMTSIPEPTSALLAAFGSLALLRRRRAVVAEAE